MRAKPPIGILENFFPAPVFGQTFALFLMHTVPSRLYAIYRLFRNPVGSLIIIKSGPSPTLVPQMDRKQLSFFQTSCDRYSVVLALFVPIFTFESGVITPFPLSYLLLFLAFVAVS